MCEIRIELNKWEFQYDVYSLTKAFFPGKQVAIFAMDACVEEGYAEKGDFTGSVLQEGQASLLVWCGSQHICVDYHKMGQPRVKKEAAFPAPWGRLEVKNLCKQLIYQVLQNSTGRTLVWGTLTGIRPVKLAEGLLAKGMEPSSARAYMEQAYYLSSEKSGLCMEIALRERALLENLDIQNGYSLYVGIPFCPSICMYCSFSSNPLEKWKQHVDAYVDALCRELCAVSRLMRGRKLSTVYIGGGTPTTLEPGQMARVMECLEINFPMGELWEFTVEAGRPDSITREKLQVLKEHMVTRISVNPQTMNQKTLDFIGRKHTVEDSKKAYWLAREMGFANINMDLIAGLPGEGIQEVEETLGQIRQMEPDSLTVHSLAVKRAARLRLFSEEHREVSFENSGRIMRMAEECARAMELVPYYLYRQKNMAGNMENVGYAREGKAGLYNIFMMEEKQPVLAVGAGGASKLVSCGGEIVKRVENVKDVSQYLERLDEMIERKKKAIEMWL